MATEAKEGEFTLVYNTESGGHPVALTKEQHSVMQLFLAGLSKESPITVIKTHYIEHIPNPNYKR